MYHLAGQHQRGGGTGTAAGISWSSSETAVPLATLPTRRVSKTATTRDRVAVRRAPRLVAGLARDAAQASRTQRSATGQPAGPTHGDGGVLVVGDSLEVLTSPYLQHYLPGVHLTINAEGGYNSNQIYGLFSESYDPSQSVIVFDAGTNDNPGYPQILAGNLAKVAATVGDRCMVVPTIHGFTVNGVDNSGKNHVVKAFAASRPGTQVPDWAAPRRDPSRPDAVRRPPPEHCRAPTFARGSSRRASRRASPHRPRPRSRGETGSRTRGSRSAD